MRDDKLQPGEAATRTLELIEKDRAHFICGTLSAAVQLSVNNVTKARGVIYVSISQSDKISEASDASEFTFHEAVNPHLMSGAVARYAVGKFGKRGVGYNVESLVSQIRKILRTAGQHNIALFGAGHLGQAIATSDIFADHGFRVVAMLDVDPAVIGRRIGGLEVRSFDELETVVSEENVVVGVLAVPAESAQEVADRLVEAGVKIIFNYSEQLLQVPPEVTVHASSPAVDLLYALYFYLT